MEWLTIMLTRIHVIHGFPELSHYVLKYTTVRGCKRVHLNKRKFKLNINKDPRH